ncbi:hypothetical protein QBC36DRAFT_336706 [Triangularia setosa]|uniref:Uncharacterized protein n=1 Tax=Triangularia setosa TaxID=2587417 RepID=A0AAN6W2C9_9PEZI|nr:hypothetical protein QBC36DRAFT_336706 [Podospora setosa]
MTVSSRRLKTSRPAAKTRDKPVETNYAVAIDASSNEKAGWLIYNRHPMDCKMSVRPDDPIDPLAMPPVFPGVAFNPDSICVMPRLDSWFLGGRLLNPNKIGSAINECGRKAPAIAGMANICN